MRRLSAIAFIVLLVVFPSCKFFKKLGLFGGKDDKVAEWQARQDSIRVADSIRKAQDLIMALENARLDSIRLAEEERLALESKSRYNIIVGSFVTPEYAADLADEYRQTGYDARILKMEGSRFELVSAEAHADFRTACNRLRAFQDTVAFDAWMYIIQ